jgi:hypothetical protein
MKKSSSSEIEFKAWDIRVCILVIPEEENMDNGKYRKKMTYSIIQYWKV